MRFSQSNHLLCLSLETLTSIIRTGLPILVELIDLVNSVIIFLSQTSLLKWLTFLLRSQRVWHAGLLHKLKSYRISGQIFGLISSFLSNRQRRVVLDAKSLQEYPVNAGAPQGFILGPTLFLLYINDLLDDVICDIAIYADTTLYSKCDQAFDL